MAYERTGATGSTLSGVTGRGGRLGRHRGRPSRPLLGIADGAGLAGEDAPELRDQLAEPLELLLGVAVQQFDHGAVEVVEEPERPLGTFRRGVDQHSPLILA
jgi:hypothetical protein